MNDQQSQTPFDFKNHEELAISTYLRKRPFYEDLANSAKSIIEECLKKRSIEYHSVSYRAKSFESFGRKAATPSSVAEGAPKYNRPLDQIKDLAGVRVITYFPDTQAAINALLVEEFDVTEHADKGSELVESEKFGYRSIHYLVKIKADRVALAEYARFDGEVLEVQVRTILQHAWAEIEHDIQYKSSSAIPTQIRRRFMALAGLLEIADREFQAIQDADQKLEKQANDKVERDQLSGVEITPASLKTFLDRRLGPDGRISDWSYNWEVGILKDLGFSDLQQVDNAINGLSDDRLSAIASNGRQGQTTRFEYMLLAAIGEKFIHRHRWRNEASFVSNQKNLLEKFSQNGIDTSYYDPIPALSAEVNVFDLPDGGHVIVAR